MADSNNVNTIERESYMLTTSDNPFNPFTEFESWYVFDETFGYHTCSLLARLCNPTTDLGDREELLVYYEACEKILMFNPTGNYKKFYQHSYEQKLQTA